MESRATRQGCDETPRAPAPVFLARWGRSVVVSGCFFSLVMGLGYVFFFPLGMLSGGGGCGWWLGSCGDGDGRWEMWRRG